MVYKRMQKRYPDAVINFPHVACKLDLTRKGPLDLYIDPARRASPISPHTVSSNLGHLVAVCVQFASLLHCLDRPGEMGDWDDEEAKARLACVPLFNRQRRDGLPI